MLLCLRSYSSPVPRLACVVACFALVAGHGGCSGASQAEQAQDALDAITEGVQPVYDAAADACATALDVNSRTCDSAQECALRHAALTAACDPVVIAGTCIRDAQRSARTALETIEACGAWPDRAGACGWGALDTYHSGAARLERCVGEFSAAWPRAQRVIGGGPDA